jgi:hypothetical protein
VSVCSSSAALAHSLGQVEAAAEVLALPPRAG